MFKNNSSSNGTSGTHDPESPERLNRVVEGTTIEGEIKCDSNIRIDGIIKGTVETKGRLVIGPSGVIEGDVICKNGDIEGKVEGEVKVEELLSLKVTSRIYGDIKTQKLAIEPGAEFTGSCNMGAGPEGTSNKADEGGRQEEKTTVQEG